ncbi:uncharacterized protein TRAVEDRAFT_41427 [Trametes versicolor FP-101664 SS1]|uniref:uncharacterized protein n=1 Tax=Trametes versicolor (strain FP-101664) TaxID=717944 RepID=UPI0004623B75|nr:uncharacterized protein TRAVEDRAFT_41427 [Trametes versicolor FP-101664 SS1]EIW64004.1 hypothetical protein TRAVEDRAFT_41427 [Trametes versicolor FP-101664 SS1]
MDATPVSTPESSHMRQAEEQRASPDPFVVTPAPGQRLARPFAPLLGHEMEDDQTQSKASIENEDWLQELTSEMGTPQETTPTARHRPMSAALTKSAPANSLVNLAATMHVERPLKRLRTAISPTSPPRDARQVQTQRTHAPADGTTVAVRAAAGDPPVPRVRKELAVEPPPQYAPAGQSGAVSKKDIFGFLADAVNVWITVDPLKMRSAPPVPVDGADIKRLIESGASSPGAPATENTSEQAQYMPTMTTLPISNPTAPGIYQSSHAVQPSAYNRCSLPSENSLPAYLDPRANDAMESDEISSRHSEIGDTREHMDVDPQSSMTSYRGPAGAGADAEPFQGATAEEVWPPLANCPSSLIRIRYLNKNGILQVLERPRNGYPERHRRGPYDISQHLSEVTRRAWNNERPNQRCIVSFFKGKVYMTEDDIEFYRSILRSVFTAVTGESAFKILSSKITKRERSDTARYFPVLNLSPHAVRILFEQYGWSSPIGSLFIEIELEHIPFFLYTLDGFYGVLEHEKELAEQVEKYLQDVKAQEVTRALVLHDANPPSDVEARVKEILSHIVVSIVDYGARDQSQGKRPIVANVHCASPTDDGVLWEEWRDAMQALGAATTFGHGKVRKHMRCDSCHAVDHPTHICPYDRLGWYDTPTPPRAKRNATRATQNTSQQGNRQQPPRGAPSSAPEYVQQTQLPRGAQSSAPEYVQQKQQTQQMQQTNVVPFSGAPLYGSLPPRGAMQSAGSAPPLANAHAYGNAQVYRGPNAPAYNGVPNYNSAAGYNNTLDYQTASNHRGAQISEDLQSHGRPPPHVSAPHNVPYAYGGIAAGPPSAPPPYGGARPQGSALPFHDPQAYGREDVPQYFGGATQYNPPPARVNVDRDHGSRPAIAPRHGQASRAQDAMRLLPVAGAATVPQLHPAPPATSVGELAEVPIPTQIHWLTHRKVGMSPC